MVIEICKLRKLLNLFEVIGISFISLPKWLTFSNQRFGVLLLAITMCYVVVHFLYFCKPN